MKARFYGGDNQLLYLSDFYVKELSKKIFQKILVNYIPSNLFSPPLIYQLQIDTSLQFFKADFRGSKIKLEYVISKIRDYLEAKLQVRPAGQK